VRAIRTLEIRPDRVRTSGAGAYRFALEERSTDRSNQSRKQAGADKAGDVAGERPDLA
jgi:hypothetical protein